MKLHRILQTSIFLIAGLLIFSACEKKYPDDYEPYHPAQPTPDNVDLNYFSPLESYPVSEMIVSDTPTYHIEGLFSLGIDTAYSTTGGSFVYNKFVIDPETGVISYNNSTNSISPGSYSVDVSVTNLTGYTVVKGAYELVIMDVPVEVTADPDSVTVTTEYAGVISQLSYTVIGDPVPEITTVDFSINPAVTGFYVGDNNEIMKSVEAEPGDYYLSVKAKTNLGHKLFEDLVFVSVQ